MFSIFLATSPLSVYSTTNELNHRSHQTPVLTPRSSARHRKDKDSKFRLILIESRIHRLARYYKKKQVLPPTWKYEAATASALIS